MFFALLIQKASVALQTNETLIDIELYTCKEKPWLELSITLN